MENEEIKQYLIDFVVKTLSECKAFSNVYGEEFVEQQLEKNVEKVITDVYVKTNIKGSYNPKIKAIILLSGQKDSPPLTIEDIENNDILKHYILHEALHAIFEKDKQEYKELGLRYSTGVDEMYLDGTSLGIGLNEGLTEWICQKAGYGCISYTTEFNIVRMLELAIGEENVMKLSKGNIKENVTKLLDLDETECKYILGLIDRIHDNEIKAFTVEKGVDNTSELENLDKSISHFEATIFEKYFGEEIADALNSETITPEIMSRMDNIEMLIQGGETPASDIFSSRLPLQFKTQIYPEILKKYRETLLTELRKNKKEATNTNVNQLPSVYKTNWLKKFKEFIKKKFTNKSKQSGDTERKINKGTNTFKNYVSDMSNYSYESVQTIKTEQLEGQKTLDNTNELDVL